MRPQDAVPLTEAQRTGALTKFAQRLAQVQAQQAELTELETSLKASIRELAPYLGRYPAGGLTIVIGTNRRFSEPKARKLLRPDLIDIVLKQVIDPGLVKALFPDIYEQSHNDFDNKVSLQIPSEAPRDRT